MYGCSSSSYLLMCHYQEDLVPWSNSDHPGLLDEGINILCSLGKEYTACTIKWLDRKKLNLSRIPAIKDYFEAILKNKD